MKAINAKTHEVQAILQGRKTQTRRIIKTQPDSRGLRTTDTSFEDYHGRKVNPPYRPGDILYVREAFRHVTILNSTTFKSRKEFWYKADHKGASIPGHDKWKPSIHMPKEAARIFLQVKSVRVERLQQIDWISAQAEGIQRFWMYNGVSVTGVPGVVYPKPNQIWTHREAFSKLWESIHGQDSWNANPWVWVIEFEETDMKEEDKQ